MRYEFSPDSRADRLTVGAGQVRPFVRIAHEQHAVVAAVGVAGRRLAAERVEMPQALRTCTASAGMA